MTLASLITKSAATLTVMETKITREWQRRASQFKQYNSLAVRLASESWGITEGPLNLKSSTVSEES